VKFAPFHTGNPDRDNTFRIERFRIVCCGIFDTAGQTFLLLIAVEAFQMGAIGKSWLAMNSGPGLLLTPLILAGVVALRMRCGLGAGRMQMLGGCFMLGAAFAQPIWLFVACCLASILCATGATPLFTQIYQENYPAFERGRIFSTTTIIRVLTIMGFSWLAGSLLAINFDWYRILLLVFAASLFANGLLAVRLPSKPYGAGEHGAPPLPTSGWRYLKEDRLFRLTLISWMLMGMGNLMMIPLRVEYLAAPGYGLQLPPNQIALFIGVIPSLVRLILSPFWGRLFDHFDFLVLRVALNILFGLGIFLFFISTHTIGLWAGAIVFGSALAGADIMWSLWVTKVAPPDRVASYMSMHTFMTGIRAMIAPFLGFGMLAILPIQGVMAISLALIVSSIFVLAPETRLRGRTASQT